MTTSKARRNRVRDLWLGLPETWRTQLASAFHTFVPAFVIAFAMSLFTAQDFSWSVFTLAGIISAAADTGARAGFKALSSWFFIRVLPDPKDT